MKHLVQHAARLALAMAACGLMFASPSRAQFDCCQTPGDANGDDSVNLADITFLIARIFSGGPAPRCLREGDSNGSGKVNISDVTFLISRIFAGGPAPECATTPLPAPFPNEIGNWWEYEKFDSLTLTLDTVHVEVKDTATLPNGELAKVWVSTVNGEIITTNHVSLVTTEAGDSVKVYDGSFFLFFGAPEMLYLYPLDTVKEWYNVAPEDSPGCHFRFVGGFPDTIQTPLQAFANSFKIWRSDIVLGCTGFDPYLDIRRVWLVNGVGLVSAIRHSINLGGESTRNRAWSLIGFDTTPPCDTCK